MPVILLPWMLDWKNKCAMCRRDIPELMKQGPRIVKAEESGCTLVYGVECIKGKLWV